jgi:Glycosyl transferase family 2
VSRVRPRLSVVLATGHPWPEAERTLRALLATDEAVDLELLLCDGSDGPDPGQMLRDDRLTVIRARGESVFSLRARGLAAARGEVVAITEDHCIPDPDWAAELIEAHARHPDAAAIAGAVANGATESSWDWANFLMTFAEHMPPIDERAARRAPSVANGSFKRSSVAIPRAPAPGWLELETMPALVSGGRVVRDGGPLVTHDQSHGGPRATLAAHFHNGRASAGLRVDRPGLGAIRAEARRLAGLPGQLIGELQDALRARPPLTGAAAHGARLASLLAIAHVAGELIGLLAGPGSSPDRLD